MMTVEDVGRARDIELHFTYHALERLRQRCDMNYKQLGQLCGSCFQLEQCFANGRTTFRILIPFEFTLNVWRMAVPFKMVLVGEPRAPDYFQVVTIETRDLSDVENSAGFTKARTVRVSMVYLPKRISRYRDL